MATNFPDGLADDVLNVRCGETRIIPVIFTASSGTIQFTGAPAATLYTQAGAVANDGALPTPADILNNASVSDYDLSAAAEIEARVTVPFTSVSAGQYMLVVAAEIGSEVLQAAVLINVD